MENISTTIKPSVQAKYSGTITVTKGRNKSETFRYIYSNADWFKEAEFYIFKENEYGFTVQKCLCIEIPNNAVKFTTQAHLFSQIPVGKYQIDEEESTTDELVIYYNTED